MVKKIELIIFFFVVSCGIKTRTLEDRITIVPVKDFSFVNKKFNDDKQLYNIDTNIIYEEFTKETFIGLNKFAVNKPERLNTSNKNTFYRAYKFYKNGCVNLFILQKKDSLTKHLLNPNFIGQRGVFYKDKDKIKLDLFSIKGYSFKTDYGLITSEISISGDTLYEYRSKVKNIFIKKKLSKEFITFDASW